MLKTNTIMKVASNAATIRHTHINFKPNKSKSNRITKYVPDHALTEYKYEKT